MVYPQTKMDLWKWKRFTSRFKLIWQVLTCEAVKFVLSAKQIGAHIIFHNFVQKLLFFIINIFAHYYLYLLSFQSLLQTNIYLSDEMA